MAATYDSKRVSVILGSHICQGFADGTFISITRNTDTFSRKVGAGGEVARIKSNDKTGRVTMTFMQTSVTNDFLSGLYLADETANAGKVPLLVVENGGTSIAKASEAWIVKPANLEYTSGDFVNRVWMLECADLSFTVGSVPG